MKKSSELIEMFNKGEKVTITLPYYSDEFIDIINSILAKILSRSNRTFLHDTVSTILREIILNAVKANAKRVFFQKNNLEINDEEDYLHGMVLFRHKVVSDLDIIREDLVLSSYRVTVSFKRENSGIEIDVVNNAMLHPVEEKRILYRFEEAEKYNSFSDAYDRIYDPEEGAGLGIMLAILLMQNAGMDKDTFIIQSNENSVSASVHIPDKLSTTETSTEVKTRIIQEVDNLPTFPEHISEIQSLCRDKNSNIDSIALKISKDPSISADVIKIANSAGFITSKRIKNIHEAILIIGLKNLENILIAAASRKILDKKYRRFEQIWDHCNQVASYARAIAEKNNMGEIKDEVFISGLLHDIGKIVLLSTDTKILDTISDIIKNRRIRTSTILEEISIGISHSTIGELIATKWNFPAYIIEAISCHHIPLYPKIKEKGIVYCVYLANMICEIEKQKYSYLYIENEILELFHIDTENKFNTFHKYLQTTYRAISIP